MARLFTFYPVQVVTGTTAGAYAQGDLSRELDELGALRTANEKPKLQQASDFY